MAKQALLRAGLTLLLAAGMVVEASGQNIGSVDAQRGVTVTTRPRPEFDPLGVRLGAFRLDAAVEGGLGYDSNIFGRNTNVKSDGFATQTAGVGLNSDWTTHALSVSGGM